MAKIEFTTARGAKIEITAGRNEMDSTVSINGGKGCKFSVRDHAEHGLVMAVTMIVPKSKTNKTGFGGCTVPVPAYVADAVSALRVIAKPIIYMDTRPSALMRDMDRADSAH